MVSTWNRILTLCIISVQVAFWNWCTFFPLQRDTERAWVAGRPWRPKNVSSQSSRCKLNPEGMVEFVRSQSENRFQPDGSPDRWQLTPRRGDGQAPIGDPGGEPAASALQMPLGLEDSAGAQCLLEAVLPPAFASFLYFSLFSMCFCAFIVNSSPHSP